jgi:hypothetical protein
MNDNQPEIRRNEIKEQAGSPTVTFVIDGHTIILPYAFFVRAECHVRENQFLIIGYWTTMTVTIQGSHLERLIQLLAEYRLLAVILRTEVEKALEDNQPYMERILVTLREESSSRGKELRTRRKSLTEKVGCP